MVQFFTVIISLYLFSHAYNVVLVLTYPASKEFTINSEMGVTNSRSGYVKTNSFPEFSNLGTHKLSSFVGKRSRIQC
jgi:hypothetical protein